MGDCMQDNAIASAPPPPLLPPPLPEASYSQARRWCAPAKRGASNPKDPARQPMIGGDGVLTSLEGHPGVEREDLLEGEGGCRRNARVCPGDGSGGGGTPPSPRLRP